MRTGTPSTRVLLVSVASVISILTFLLADCLLGLLGFPSAPTVQIAHPAIFEEVRVSLEYRYDFRTNSLGLRDDEPPPDSIFRIYLAGDSFAEGFGVSEQNRFGEYLESRLLASRVINGGLAGTGPLGYGRALLHIGLPLRPDAVIIAFYANDVVNTPPDIFPAELTRTTVTPTGWRRWLHIAAPRTYTMLHRLWTARRHSTASDPHDLRTALIRRAREAGVHENRIDAWQRNVPDSLVRAVEIGQLEGSPLIYGLLNPQYWQDALAMESTEARRRWEAAASLLTALADSVRAHRIPIALVYLPSRLQYDATSFAPTNPWVAAGCRVDRAWLRDTAAVQKRLNAWARQQGIPFLDLTPAFRRAADPARLTWTYDEHWTPAGHRLAAEAIGEWIEQTRPFDGPWTKK